MSEIPEEQQHEFPDKKNQMFLFEELNDDWKLEWIGMPEYSHEDLSPWKSLIIHFECKQELEKFAELINQKLYETTKSRWFPEAEIGTTRDRRYVDE